MKLQSAQLLVGLTLLGSTVAFGQFTPIPQPDATYTGATTVIPLVGANGTATSSVSDGTMTVSLSPTLSLQTVPGGGWSTWNSPPAVENATPRVLVIYTSTTTATLTLSTPRNIFGFELEPDTFSSFSVTADFRNGSTSLGTITRSVNGSAGALLFAASSTTPITSVVLTVPSGANGFALAQLRYASVLSVTSVPTLSTSATAGLSMLLLAAGALLARRQAANA